MSSTTAPRRSEPAMPPGPSPAPAKALVVLGSGVAAVGWAAIFVRLSDDAPPLTQAAYRMLFAATVLAAFSGVRLWRGKDRLPARTAWPLLALTGILLAGHFWSWFASLDRTSVGSSVVIVAMQPLLAGMLGLIFLRESPTVDEYAGIALATIGLVIIGGRDFVSGGAHELAGDGLALLGALLAAGYLTVGRSVRTEVSAGMYSTMAYGVAALALWLLCAALRPRLGGFDVSTWSYLVLLALLPQVVGHTALNWSLAHFRVVTVSLAIVGEPIIATLLAIPILGEHPTVGVLAGGPFILIGIAIGLSGMSRRRITRRPVVVPIE